MNELLVLSPDTPGGVQSNASVTNLEVLCPGTKTRRFYPDVLQQHRADDVEVYTCVLNAYWRKFWDNIALMMESRLELYTELLLPTVVVWMSRRVFFLSFVGLDGIAKSNGSTTCHHALT